MNNNLTFEDIDKMLCGVLSMLIIQAKVVALTSGLGHAYSYGKRLITPHVGHYRQDKSIPELNTSLAYDTVIKRLYEECDCVDELNHWILSNYPHNAAFSDIKPRIVPVNW
jgi:hypothetical protein